MFRIKNVSEEKKREITCRYLSRREYVERIWERSKAEWPKEEEKEKWWNDVGSTG